MSTKNVNPLITILSQITITIYNLNYVQPKAPSRRHPAPPTPQPLRAYADRRLAAAGSVKVAAPPWRARQERHLGCCHSPCLPHPSRTQTFRGTVPLQYCTIHRLSSRGMVAWWVDVCVLVVCCVCTATVLPDPARIQKHHQHHVARCQSGPSTIGAASTLVAIGHAPWHSGAAPMQ